jgi:hypothetical protein
MLDFIDAVHQLGAGVLEMVLRGIEIGMDHYEGVFHDRARQHGAALAAVELGEVRAAAGEADAKGRAGHDHGSPVVMTMLGWRL